MESEMVIDPGCKVTFDRNPQQYTKSA